jgi:hypothetical protein
MNKAQLRTNAERRARREKYYTVVGGVLILAALVGVVLLVWQKTTQRVDTGDYDGRIVDRWAAYAESEQGSRPYFRLLIEDQDGRLFTVKVDANVYESARVGMRIRSRAGQVVWIDSEDRKAGGK